MLLTVCLTPEEEALLDAVSQELWETKDQIAKEHDDDLDRLLESLRRKSSDTNAGAVPPTARVRQADPLCRCH
jgi:hypothetical protein